MLQLVGHYGDRTAVLEQSRQAKRNGWRSHRCRARRAYVRNNISVIKIRAA